MKYLVYIHNKTNDKQIKFSYLTQPIKKKKVRFEPNIEEIL